MDVIIIFISGILILGLIALVAWGIWTYVNDPFKIKNLFKNVKEFTGTEESKIKKQEEYKSSQEEIIRSIVKEEIERMYNRQNDLWGKSKRNATKRRQNEMRQKFSLFPIKKHCSEGYLKPI